MLSQHFRQSFTFIALLLLPLFTVSLDALAQEGNGEHTDEEQLLKLIRLQYGYEYRCAFYTMDSLIDKDNGPGSPVNDITDPYFQLRHTILFCAYLSPADYPNQDCSILGFLRDGIILWSAPFFMPGILLDINGASDLNNDGAVDLITLWSGYDTIVTARQYIWIISWDGASGQLINDYNETERTSNLVTMSGWLQLINGDRDEYWELRGYAIPDQEQTVSDSAPPPSLETYGWNGSRYGKWSSVRQVPRLELLPADLFSAGVTSSVSKLKDTLTYTYSISNSPLSKQKIQSIYLADVSRNTEIGCRSPWLTQFEPRMHGISWNVWDIYKSSMIKPGDTSNQFTLRSPALPKISKYYLQGYRANPVILRTDHFSEGLIEDDLRSNSVRGYTIAPGYVPSPDNLPAVLDTLSSLIRQSFTVGWISNKNTAIKYVRIIRFTETVYIQKKMTAFKKDLDLILQEAEKDRLASTIAPECSTLIYQYMMYLKHKVK